MVWGLGRVREGGKKGRRRELELIDLGSVAEQLGRVGRSGGEADGDAGQ